MIDECWFYARAVDKSGYAILSYQQNGKNYSHRVHKIMYEFYIGEVPQGLELDHLCRNRSCINPNHLDAVTHKVNMSRGKFAMQNTCLKGHKYRDKPRARGGRVCLTCKNERQKRYYKERKLAHV